MHAPYYHGNAFYELKNAKMFPSIIVLVWTKLMESTSYLVV
jgi:hypothetical protein